MTTGSFQLTLDIAVEGLSDGEHIAPYVNDAVQELVNRRDFRDGTISTGRALTHRIDFGRVCVSIDVDRSFTGAD